MEPKFVERYVTFIHNGDGTFEAFFWKRKDDFVATQNPYLVRIPVPKELWDAPVIDAEICAEPPSPSPAGEERK